MSKKNILLFSGILIFIIVVSLMYLKITDDTYEGMSIIPEQHKDIPLFDGLKPTNHQYVMKGNHWEDIYEFYMEKLPTLGWKVEYQQSALDDTDTENDWSGFHSSWRKEGFDGELWIGASYNQYEEKTEVIFDKNPIYTSTPWIEEIPERICVYEVVNSKNCLEINDKSNINELMVLINSSNDWDEEEIPKREKTSVIDFGIIDIKVFYGDDEEIYFQSDKGIKIMKPEGEFFQLTKLTQ
ncbi:hypothetical protein [Bacillus suaedaesalsae]|uniref:Uncharacterized protein n=1 Tax=Bacillus suaedaesalsae TaxID=2810349 RepID=A0ABS2DK83_9BACI|nr:hypothetical protein [Bacillus suaedaesalsae]MBM6618822.1 hypothetical protein [Bacillus suaedaesalsae]